MSNGFLTAETIAAVMETTPHTVRRLIRNGDIKSFRIGAQHRVRLEDFAEYLAGTANWPVDTQEVMRTIQNAPGFHVAAYKGGTDDEK